MAKLIVFLMVLLVISTLLVSSPNTLSSNSQILDADIILEIEVRKGWNLTEITKGVGMSKINLFKLNKITPDLAIRPGEKLLVAPYHTFNEVQVSWYGPKFQGQTMANGKIFDMNDPAIVAHKWLPFGTQIRLTWTETGTSVVVTVQDRGPYIKGRHFDLSKSAARELGIVAVGIAKCKVEIIS